MSKAAGEDRSRPSAGRGCLILLAVLILLLALVIGKLFDDFIRNVVPTGLPIEGIAYREEQAWGIGLPGDNETGVRVFRLSEQVSQEIASGGIPYLRRYGRISRPGQRSRGIYSEWHETPALHRYVANEAGWSSSGESRRRAGRQVRIGDYLGMYGFNIDIDPEVEAMIDAALARPGSYYAFGRSGVFLVSPDRRTAIFAYAG